MAHEAGSEFESFVAEQLPRLRALARLLTGNHPDAEDLVHDALIRVGLKWRSVDKNGNPGAYVRTTLVRLNLNRVRRRALERRLLRLQRAMPVASAGPTSSVELPDWLEGALETLTPNQRAAVVLRFLEDLMFDEIALIIGCSAGTVRSHVSRGVAQLRAFAPAAEEEAWRR